MSEKLVLDTSVLVEFIIAKSPFRKTIAELFSKAEHGDVELYVNTVTLAETSYIVARIYGIAGVKDPNKESENFIMWIMSKANVVNIDVQLSKSAGELKKRLGISLPDCLVIASANALGGKALFKKVESEMLNIIEKLRELKVIFLEEIS